MLYHEFVPYDDLLEATQDKLAYLDPNQQTICTPEFQQLSTSFYGSLIFGGNTTVTAAKIGCGVEFMFHDRIIGKSRDISRPVATLTNRGLRIVNETVVADWASKRVVNEDGSISFNGLREAGESTTLPSNTMSVGELSNIVTHTSAWRRRMHLIPTSIYTEIKPPNPDTGPLQARGAQIAKHLRMLSNSLAEDAITDISEALTTEYRQVPHALTTPGAAQAIEAIAPADTQKLVCNQDGLWVGRVDPRRDVVLNETFIAGGYDRHHHLGAVEEAFDDPRGIRMAVAVGKALTYDEKGAINSYGRSKGPVYLTPVPSFPHGTIYTNDHYRVFAPRP